MSKISDSNCKPKGLKLKNYPKPGQISILPTIPVAQVKNPPSQVVLKVQPGRSVSPDQLPAQTQNNTNREKPVYNIAGRTVSTSKQPTQTQNNTNREKPVSTGKQPLCSHLPKLSYNKLWSGCKYIIKDVDFQLHLAILHGPNNVQFRVILPQELDISKYNKTKKCFIKKTRKHVEGGKDNVSLKFFSE